LKACRHFCILFSKRNKMSSSLTQSLWSLHENHLSLYIFVLRERDASTKSQNAIEFAG
jgi:hypothetical protein